MCCIENNYWMVRVAAVECCKLPLVPVMVSVRFPLVALLDTRTVRVELPEPVIEDGLKVGVTRDPWPLTLRVTVPVNPFTPVMVTVYEPEVPRVTLSEEGDTEMVKSGVAPAFTTSVTLVE